MANKKISQLPAISVPLKEDDLFEVAVDNGGGASYTSHSTTGKDIKALVGGLKGLHSLIPLESGEWTSNFIGASGTSFTNTATYSEKVVCFPYIPNQTFTISSLNINVATAYTTGSVIRLSIYSDLNGKPNELLLNSTDLSANPSGLKTYNVTFTFEAGVTYWFGYQSSNANNTGTMSGVPSANLVYIKNNGTFGSSTTKYIFNAPYASGAPTSLLGAAYTVDNSANPAFFLVKA